MGKLLWACAVSCLLLGCQGPATPQLSVELDEEPLSAVSCAASYATTADRFLRYFITGDRLELSVEVSIDTPTLVFVDATIDSRTCSGGGQRVFIEGGFAARVACRFGPDEMAHTVVISAPDSECFAD